MSLDVSTADWEVQIAFKTALEADSTLMGKVTGIYDAVPQGTDYPYVVLGDSNEDMEDTFDTGMTEISYTIHVWSRYKGKEEAKSIQSDVERVLHRQPLTLATLHCVFVLKDYRDVIDDPDGLTRHGVQRFRVLVQSV